jgi:hypothetical protein
VTLEAVIGQDAAKVRVVGEIDAQQIPGLPFPPSGAVEQPDRGRHRLLFIGLYLQTDTLIEGHAEEVVNDLEAELAVRVIHATDVAQHRERTFRVVAQKL